MKLGDGGEAFFVFETEGAVPSDLLTSPVISPTSSPRGSESPPPYPEPDFLDLARSRSRSNSPNPRDEAILDEPPSTPPPRNSLYASRSDWADSFPSLTHANSPPPLSKEQIIERARQLSRKLTDINIPSKITDNGDLVLDITGYKSDETDIKQSEAVVREILIEEFGETSIEQLMTRDNEGNLRISGTSDEAGYTSDDMYVRPGTTSPELFHSMKVSKTFPGSTAADSYEGEKSYAKTLRLTSDQLKMLNLKPGMNDISFSVREGKAVCNAKMFYWQHNVPIVISDIDGTITKSDAMGHMMAMIGRDWTHPGVGKLFTDIESNGYNIMYLTARSVGLADTTRSYLQGVQQNGFRLPDGPVILSPDRTMAALRREVIMKKPEVFKMACLRDIKSLYGELDETPFYAGFGNRITDALSYRSVGVPSSRIFTINSLGDVHMELLELAGYKSSYVHIADLVDHFFPPVRSSFRGEETYTDLNFWREPIADLSDWETDEDSVHGNDGATGGDPDKKIDMARSPRRKDSRAAPPPSNLMDGNRTDGSPPLATLQPPAQLYGEHEEGLDYGEEEDDEEYDEDDDYDEDAIDDEYTSDEYDEDEDHYEEDEEEYEYEDEEEGEEGEREQHLEVQGDGEHDNHASRQKVDAEAGPKTESPGTRVPEIVSASSLLENLHINEREQPR